MGSRWRFPITCQNKRLAAGVCPYPRPEAGTLPTPSTLLSVISWRRTGTSKGEKASKWQTHEGDLSLKPEKRLPTRVLPNLVLPDLELAVVLGSNLDADGSRGINHPRRRRCHRHHRHHRRPLAAFKRAEPVPQ